MHHTIDGSPSYRRNIQQALASRPTSTHHSSPSPPSQPTNDDIEAVIQMATSTRQTPDGRTAPVKDTRTQLFVGNLPYRVRWQDLKDLFRRAGTVLRADVSLGPDNRSRGYGTVLLATAEDAGRAIDLFHGYSWQTRILEVRPDRLPPDFDNPHSVPAPNSLPPLQHFSVLSSVSLSTPLPPASQIASPSRSVRNLSDDLDYSAIFGSEASNASSSGCRNLFVGNLPFHCQWQDLKDLFRQAGTIMRADVALGPDGRSRGFGTVVFATEQDAERAVKMFNGYEYNGRALKVHFDRYSHIGQPSASPTHPTFHQGMPSASMSQPSFTTTMTTRPSHITLPLGYHPELFTPSTPSTPYDLYHSNKSIFSQAVQSQQPQKESSTQLQPNEHSSARPHHDGASRSQDDVDLISSQLASASISARPGPISPRARTTTLSHNNRTSDPFGSENVWSQATPQAERPQPKSQPPKSTSAPTAASPSQNQHPHHPGPISLPPPNLPFPVAPHTLSPLHHPGMAIPISPIQHPNMGSPLHHPSSYPSHQQIVPMTPHGLPPITPSMPPFIFHPVPAPPSPTAPTHTNTAHIPMYGPSFSPTVALSPGTFWGRPGSHHSNPFINPAVGAPVHAHSPGTRQGGNSGVGGSAYFYAPPAAGRPEPTGYFDHVYLPPGTQHPSSGLGPSGLANEILKEAEEQLDDEAKDHERLAEDGTPSAGNNSNDNDDGIGRSASQDSTTGTNTTPSTFSESTSWYNSEESGDEQVIWGTHESGIVGMSLGNSTNSSTNSVSGSGNMPTSGLGVGILGAERKNISRTHSMSGRAKPLFLSSYMDQAESDPPTRTSSSGNGESTSVTRVTRWPTSPLTSLATQVKGKEQQK